MICYKCLPYIAKGNKGQARLHTTIITEISLQVFTPPQLYHRIIAADRCASRYSFLHEHVGLQRSVSILLPIYVIKIINTFISLFKLHYSSIIIYYLKFFFCVSAGGGGGGVRGEFNPSYWIFHTQHHKIFNLVSMPSFFTTTNSENLSWSRQILDI